MPQLGRYNRKLKEALLQRDTEKALEACGFAALEAHPDLERLCELRAAARRRLKRQLRLSLEK